MKNGFQLSEGTFIYLLGLVMIASRSGHFWLGFVLAMTPLIVGATGRAIGAARWHR